MALVRRATEGPNVTMVEGCSTPAAFGARVGLVVEEQVLDLLGSGGKTEVDRAN
jgi:hypothetical protein